MTVSTKHTKSEGEINVDLAKPQIEQDKSDGDAEYEEWQLQFLPPPCIPEPNHVNHL